LETLETRCLLTGVALEPLVPADVLDGDQFGTSIAIDADTLLAGAPGADGAAGAAYVFGRSGETWVEQARLTATDLQPHDTLGYAVAVDGDLMVVGAPQLETDRSGAIYVFARTNGTWSEQARLLPDDTTGIRQFGQSVSLDGNVIVVGAKTVSDDHGAAFVFRFDGSQWAQEARLEVNIPASPFPPAPVIDVRRFGSAVAVDGNTIVVGAPRSRFAPADRSDGALMIFEYRDNRWDLDTGFADLQGFFGSSVAIDNDRTVRKFSNNGRGIACLE